MGERGSRDVDQLEFVATTFMSVKIRMWYKLVVGNKSKWAGLQVEGSQDLSEFRDIQ